MELLEISLEDLGLHERANDGDFHFREFPELPPLDLKRDDGWQIGLEELDPLQDVDSERFGKKDLGDWLGPYPAWIRQPPTGFNWLKVSDDLNRHLLAQKLKASGRYEVVVAETLAAVAIRLRNSKPVIVAVERDGGGDDLAALAERPEDAGILIIAPFMFASREEISSAEWMSWEARTARGKEGRKFDLTAKRFAPRESIQRWELKKVIDWREQLLCWVERRLNRSNVDTHFSAQAIQDWLKSFDPAGLWFRTTSDLLQLCHLAHCHSEKRLPKARDTQAGTRLAQLLFVREPVAKQYVMEEMTWLRWQSKLPWERPLSLRDWLEISGGTGAKVTRTNLEEIVAGITVRERKEIADRVAVWVELGNPHALLESGLLREVTRGAFDYQNRTFVRLLVRDRLMAQIANDSLSKWALSCFDPTRRTLIDAALDAAPLDSLAKAAHRLRDESGGSAQSLAAAEALFVAIGKRIAKQENIPVTLYSVATQVIRHLDTSDDGMLAQPWTRPMETIDDQLAWLCACWSWSLLPETVVDGVPGWLFPGWAKASTDLPYWLEQLMPDKKAEDLSSSFRAYWQVLVEWAKEIDCPGESWPAMMVAPFLVKAMKGGGPARSAWWRKLIGQDWAEKLLLECCEQVGKDAASRVWPSLVMAEREVAERPNKEEDDEPPLYKFERSRIRFWLIGQLKPTEVLRGLNNDDLVYLAHRPESLPPEVRADLLLSVKDCLPFMWPGESRAFLERFGFHAAPALEAFLGHEVIGLAATQYLWRWNPVRALTLLAEKDVVTTSVRNALYWDCTPQYFPQALALLAKDPEVFDREERQRWIRRYLPNAGLHAVPALELLKTE
ncbi:MAG: hypothetical protein HGA75_13755 [Thiobacillus sp.]|nr:hypothetical protein [Thiobacillus sp.]